MSLNNKGRTGGVQRTSQNFTLRRLLQLEKIISLETRGLSNKQIAEHLGVTVVTIAKLKSSPEYLVKMQEVRTQLSSQLTDDINSQSGALRVRLENEVPSALQTLFDLARQRADLRIAASAATEILDREGSFAKVSRLGGPNGEPIKAILPITSVEAGIADELVDALRTA